MAEKLGIDNNSHELKLGKSFDVNNKVALHSIRYDFKPESLDTTKTSILEVEQNNSITMTVPHVEGSGTSHTLYKGNKRPVQKECVLIIDHDSGEFCLEKISNAIQLKKTRTEGTSKISKSFLNAEKTKKELPKPKNPKVPSTESEKSQPPAVIGKEPVGGVSPVDMMSETSSSSDSDEEQETMEAFTTNSYKPTPTSTFSNLSEDLRLSDSGSDSD